jgi:hypothetical protein
VALSYGMKPLNLEKALKLYDLLGEYIPDEIDETQFIDFVGKIVHNIREDEPSTFIDALVLMTGHSEDEILEFPPEYGLKLFMNGLIINDVIRLKEFCREIHYGW